MEIIVAEFFLPILRVLERENQKDCTNSPSQEQRKARARHFMRSPTSTRIRMSLKLTSRISPRLITSRRVPLTTRNRISNPPCSRFDTVKTWTIEAHPGLEIIGILFHRSLLPLLHVTQRERTLLKMILGCGRANLTNATPVMNDMSSIEKNASTTETQLEHEFFGYSSP